MKLACTPAFAVAALAGLAFSSAGFAKDSPASPSETARIEQILAAHAKVIQVGSVALSHDGSHLAWTQSKKGKKELMLASWDGKNAHAVKIPGDCHEEDIHWAPDSDNLAILTRCKVDPSNTKPIKGALWVVDGAGKAAPRKVTDLSGFASDVRWSRGGQRIAFMYVPGATRMPFATASGNPRVGVIGQEAEQVERIAEVPTSGGTPNILTPASLCVYEFDFSPDGHTIAYTAAPPPGDDHWWSAKLYTQKDQAGATPEVVVDPATVTGSLHGMQMQQPTWSPDGKSIYFVGGLMSDRGADAGELYRVAPQAGQVVDMTPGIPVTLHQFTFLTPDTLVFTQEKLGHVQIAKYTISDSAAQPSRVLYTLPGAVRGVSISSSAPHRIAYAASSFEHAPEVYSGALGDQPPSAVTAVNAALKPSWGKARSVTWHSGKLLIQGWLLYPANFDPHKTYPLIVSVHGGPTFANLPYWGTNATAYSSFGYFVLLPNPRGSTGEGEAFVRENIGTGKMGYGDLDDILAGIDAVEKIAPVDNNRLGMTGWSYGGFMSMFAPTQTNRFKAVVAGAGISDWKSYYGENQIDGWMIPFFGASVYQNPSAYEKSSAINFITRDHTPALIVVGERDEECPAPQSFEYWHALQTLGVPSKLVVYANQGHGIANHDDQVDILRRSLDWFGKYLAAAPAK
ncbi:prolyl oligopeptidase family serine peptidase [Rhodanobacter sp. 115]|uniref:S9 family peptidase n=1 Tax=Rhodanobacter sp. FW021-MT20 TaxID=1162282 RepID=UPI0034E3E17D